MAIFMLFKAFKIRLIIPLAQGLNDIMGLAHLLFWAKPGSSSYINRVWGFDEYPALLPLKQVKPDWSTQAGQVQTFSLCIKEDLRYNLK